MRMLLPTTIGTEKIAVHKYDSKVNLTIWGRENGYLICEELV